MYSRHMQVNNVPSFQLYKGGGTTELMANNERGLELNYQ